MWRAFGSGELKDQSWSLCNVSRWVVVLTCGMTLQLAGTLKPGLSLDQLNYCIIAVKLLRNAKHDLCRFFWDSDLYTSVMKYSTWDCCWSSSVLYANNFLPSTMTRTRFQAICSFVQVTPPAHIDHKGTYTWTIFETGWAI